VGPLSKEDINEYLRGRGVPEEEWPALASSSIVQALARHEVAHIASGAPDVVAVDADFKTPVAPGLAS